DDGRSILRFLVAAVYSIADRFAGSEIGEGKRAVSIRGGAAHIPGIVTLSHLQRHVRSHNRRVFVTTIQQLPVDMPCTTGSVSRLREAYNEQQRDYAYSSYMLEQLFRFLPLIPRCHHLLSSSATAPRLHRQAPAHDHSATSGLPARAGGISPAACDNRSRKYCQAGNQAQFHTGQSELPAHPHSLQHFLHLRRGR